MIGTFLLAITISINVLAVWKNGFMPLKLMAGFSWLLPLMYVVYAQPAFLSGGTQLQTAVVVILIGITTITLFWAFRSNLQVNTKSSKNGVEQSVSTENGGWHLPKVLKNGYNNALGIQPSGRERTNAMNMRYNQYRKQVHDALFQPTNTRRRR